MQLTAAGVHSCMLLVIYVACVHVCIYVYVCLGSSYATDCRRYAFMFLELYVGVMYAACVNVCVNVYFCLH